MGENMLFPKEYQKILEQELLLKRDNPYLYDIQIVKETKRFPLSILPERGFIADYVRYATGLTDAPIEFHIMTAMSLMGTVTNKYFYRFGDTLKRLNLWIIIVASTAFFRKSTATKIGVKILNMIMDNPNDTLLYPNDFSSEKLISELAETPHGLFHWDEFGGVMGRFNRQYMSGAKELFTELFENAYFKRKIKSESDVVIRNPHISILTSTTFDWFEDKVLAEDIEGGWLNRFTYCFSQTKIRNESFATHTASPCDQVVLRDQLYVMSKTNREMEFTPEALQIYDRFYHKFNRTMDEKNDRIKNLYIRLPLYCLKFACLYQINEDTYSTLIGKRAMQRAIVLVDWLLNTTYIESKNRLLQTKTSKNAIRVFKIIKKRGKKGIKRSELLKCTHMLAKELDMYLDTLKQDGSIEEVEALADVGRRFATTYKAL